MKESYRKTGGQGPFKQNLRKDKTHSKAFGVSEDHLRMLLDQCPALIYMKDDHLRHLYGNTMLLEQLETTLAEFEGTRCGDFFPLDVAAKVENADNAVLSGQKRIDVADTCMQLAGEPTYWRHVKFPIVGTSGEMFVAGVALDITERMQVEQAVSEQLEFERLIADISANLAQVEPEKLGERIESTLKALGTFLHTERAFLFQFSEDNSSLKFTNGWAAEGINLSSSIFEVDLTVKIPWATQLILDGGEINTGPGLDSLPEEAIGLRDWLEHDGINSGVVIPVRAEGRSIGMLGLDTVDQPRGYPQAIVDRLRIVASMIGSTLRRVRAQEKAQQYQHIVESTTNPVGLVDRNYIYLYVNDAYCSSFDKNRHEIIGRSVADLIGREMFHSKVKQEYDRCFTGEQATFQSWYEFPGWGRRYMDIRYSPFYGSDGVVNAVIVSSHDITEVKRIESKLKESDERFRAFMDNNPAVAYMKNESGQHLYGNQILFDMFKTSQDKFTGTTARDFFPEEITKKIEAHDSKVLTYGNPVETEPYYIEIQGQGGWWKEIKFPFTGPSGETMIGGLAINISELKNAEEEVRKAYNEIKVLKDRIEQENIYLREEIEVQHQHENIVGKSRPIMEMLSKAEQVAETDSTVLILGETGTGKELLARAIHRMSARHQRPMITVNCAALPPTLIESEMFGRDKGAFTGALSSRIGRFEIADDATVFLDEIGELSPEVQIKLLRVLEDGRFERLGSNKTIKVDVRIIAATNRDLSKAVHEGIFRRDLFYRLNVFPITVPPLRDRIEDLELLVWAFVKEYGDHMGKRIESIPRTSMDSLKRCPWNGNVRELRNVIEQSMIVTRGSVLNVQFPGVSGEEATQSLLLQDVEREHIKKIMEQTGWRVRGKAGAAELLGLKPTTLDARMKKLGIVRPK